MVLRAAAECEPVLRFLLTAQSDTDTTASWDGLLGSRDLSALAVEDFEVIHHSAPIDVTFDCTRTPITM